MSDGDRKNESGDPVVLLPNQDSFDREMMRDACERAAATIDGRCVYCRQDTDAHPDFVHPCLAALGRVLAAANERIAYLEPVVHGLDHRTRSLVKRRRFGGEP